MDANKYDILMVLMLKTPTCPRIGIPIRNPVFTVIRVAYPWRKKSECNR